MTNDIQVSALLALYNNSQIVWLALEALCRQKTEVSWELIIAEEDSSNFFGEAQVNAYVPRLNKAGCVSIRYITTSRIPLSKKWAIMAQEAHGKALVMCSSDDYSPPDRIANTHKHLVQGEKTWLDYNNSPFINLQNGNTASYYNVSYRSGIWMSLLREDLIKLDRSTTHYPKSGVDTWMFEGNPCRHKSQFCLKLGQTPHGFCTDGCNGISTHRSGKYGNLANSKYHSHFRHFKADIRDFVPLEIIDRLNAQFGISISGAS